MPELHFEKTDRCVRGFEIDVRNHPTVIVQPKAPKRPFRRSTFEQLRIQPRVIQLRRLRQSCYRAIDRNAVAQSVCDPESRVRRVDEQSYGSISDRKIDLIKVILVR